MMAGLDYCSCNECGKRLFYDGEQAARTYMQLVGVPYVVCSKCYEKKEKRITSLLKYSKRGR